MTYMCRFSPPQNRVADVQRAAFITALALEWLRFTVRLRSHYSCFISKQSSFYCKGRF